MLKVASLILVCLSFLTVVLGQNGEPQLLDTFERISCSDFRFRVDSFMAKVASNPATTGYVVLSANANYLNVFRRRKMIDEQLALRNFGKNRVVFARREGLAPLEVEFWIGTVRSELPFGYDSTWSYYLPRRGSPILLVTGGWDDSECPPAREAEFVAPFLSSNPLSRANIVIRCRGRDCFREMRGMFTKDLVEHGVSPERLKFFHVPINSEYYKYEFWILN